MINDKVVLRKESTLDKIDAYYEKQPKNIFLISAFLLALIIGYLVYEYTYEDSENYLEEQKNTLQKASNELDSLNRYIDEQTRLNTIVNLQAQLNSAKEELKAVLADNQYFDKKLSEVSKVLYNQENWSAFMSKLIASSHSNKIKTIGIKSRRNDFGMQSIQEAFNVEFDIAGRYQNLIKFINDLERSQDVVDVKEIRFNRQSAEVPKPTHPALNVESGNKAQKTPPADQVGAHVLISIWGLKY